MSVRTLGGVFAANSSEMGPACAHAPLAATSLVCFGTGGRPRTTTTHNKTKKRRGGLAFSREDPERGLHGPSTRAGKDSPCGIRNTSGCWVMRASRPPGSGQWPPPGPRSPDARYKSSGQEFSGESAVWRQRWQILSHFIGACDKHRINAIRIPLTSPPEKWHTRTLRECSIQNSLTSSVLNIAPSH